MIYPQLTNANIIKVFNELTIKEDETYLSSLTGLKNINTNIYTYISKIYVC